MIRLIIWIFIGILALSFFGISLQNIIESPVNRQNFSYFFELVADGFDDIIAFFTVLIEYLISIFPPIPEIPFDTN